MKGRTLAARLAPVYAIGGAPVAWLAQINLNYPLVATPCFAGPERKLSFPPSAQWAFITALLIYAVMLAAALSAGLLAWRLFKSAGGPEARSRAHFEGGGTGRVRFLAYCGILLSLGFSLLLLVNIVAFIMVPPCAI